MRRLLAILLAMGCGRSAITPSRPEPPSTAITHPAGTAITSIALEGPASTLDVDADDVVWVNLGARNALERIDLRSARSVGTLPMGGALETSALHPVRRVLYVALSNALAVVDLDARQLTSTLALAAAPTLVFVSEQRGVIATRDGRLQWFDPRTDAPGDTQAGLDGASAGALSRTGLYLASATTLREVPVDTRLPARSLSLGKGRPQALAVSTDGDWVYLADADGPLRVFELDRFFELSSSDAAKGAAEVKLSPDGAQLWVSRPLSGEVVVLEPNSLRLLKRIAVGGRPGRIAFGARGAVAVVANESRLDLIR
jgi:DNA-binding beta-propeller fold protein YncE